MPGLTDLVETLAEGRYDLLHVTAPGPAGIAAMLLGRITGMPLVGSYHTELDRLRRHAHRRRRPRGDGAGGDRRLLQRPLGRPLAEPVRRLLARRPRRREGADRALGARRQRLPLRPGQGRPRRLSGRDQGPLRRPDDAREGRRPARRRLPPCPPQRAAAPPAARRRRPRGGRAAGAARRAAPPSSAGSRARTWPAPTPAPTCSSSARGPTPTGRSCSRPAPAGCR